jgi:ribosome maturation factor RimP
MAQYRGRVPRRAQPESGSGGAQLDPGLGAGEYRPRRTDGGEHRARRSGAGEHRSRTPTGTPNALRARLGEIVAPVVTAGGYDLEALSISRVGRRHLLRVVVDADGGVSLDAVADLSREISAALDAAEEAGGELVTGEYQLEVGSPGVDRPLTEPRHWRRNVGRLVTVKAEDRVITGRILGADEAGVRLDLDGVVHNLSHAALGPGRVQVEFGRIKDLAEDDSAEDDLDEIEVEGEDEE